MALYAALADDDFVAVCAELALGDFASAAGIPQGSINTNYFLHTSTGRYFLRHTTVRSDADLRFEAALLLHLRESRFPAPHLHLSRSGEPFLALAGGRVSVFGYLPGEELTRDRLATDHLERLGAELAKLHRAGNSLFGDRANPYGPPLVRRWLTELAAHPDEELRGIARECEDHLDKVEQSGGLTPRGVIHADLFMDNVKWLGDRVSAFFDFEMACRDELVLDVAITLNAWCFDREYQPALCRALLRGYQDARKLSPGERGRLYQQAIFGAVRYTASRIRDFHLSPLPPERLFRKDFRTYLARVRALDAMGPGGFEDLLFTGRG
ncbi:MAG TPA: homoserine kinase [Myxococcaceae bacterium]|nr:homoserine kinase [Myxococcaceae bacterium]